MKKEKQTKPCYANVGGQALMGGISMRAPTQNAFVVRLPNGDLHIETRPVKLLRDRYAICRVPVIRGVVSFLETLLSGYRDLMRSADLTVEEDEQPKSEFEQKHGDKMMAAAGALGTVLGLALALLMMFVLPAWLVKLIDGVLPLGAFKGVLEGLLKIVIFLVYVLAVSRTKEIKEVFMYHGAEHKAIFCHEKGLPLTVENVRAQKRFHPRCGTSFILIMVVVGVIVAAFVTWDSLWVRVALKLLTFPVTLGLGYELLKLCGKYDNWLTRILSAPGMWFQRITTVEPDDDGIIEVGIASLQAALGLEITVPVKANASETAEETVENDD
ncbi:MAG: DUF1385 domain-containing protein [Clostridia bacterium]|nr:DUF1385 domain-containing protein [Clostridia bacterium]